MLFDWAFCGLFLQGNQTFHPHPWKQVANSFDQVLVFQLMAIGRQTVAKQHPHEDLLDVLEHVLRTSGSSSKLT